MHRIDTPSATTTNQFTEGSPTGGVPATVVSDDWLNDVQENICKAIEGAGITLQKGNFDQLRLAIIALATGAGAAGFNVNPVGGIDFYVGNGPTFKLRWMQFSLGASPGANQQMLYSSALTGNVGGSGNGVLFALTGVVNAAFDQVGVNNITNTGLVASKGTADNVARTGWVLVGGY